MLAAASRGALRTARTSLTDLAAELPGAAGISGVSEGLFGVVPLLDRSGQLRRALGDPTTPAPAKESLLDSLLGEQLDPLAMRVLKEIVAQDPSLRAVLTDRGLDNERKAALLTGLLGERTRAETLRLVTSLVSAPRGRTLEDGLAEYARLAAEIRERSVARVTSAVRLTEAQEERLAAALARTLGRDVQLQIDVDPAVIGGVVVRVGDEVIDGTTRHHLRAARVALSRH
jgi:F-type H+-transporting ATPase subunit delta